MNPLIDTSFQSTYDNLKKVIPHASLLYGVSGVGLLTIAKSLLPQQCELIIVIPSQKTKSALTTIGIERIRELYEEVKTTVPQLVVIDDAEKMTDAAQNALLKLLEEPNKYTSFILTSHSPEQLLDTIRSRAQSYFVPTVSGSAITEQIEETSGIIAAKRHQIKFLSNGLPAELMRLLADDEYFRLRSSQMQLAKTILEATPYDATAILVKQKLDRTQAVKVIEDAVHLLKRSPSESGVKKISSLLKAHEAIIYGGNPRLHLVRAML